MIVNIKYDLVQCKQINIACIIHLNRKKDLCNNCNNNLQLARLINNTDFQCTSRVVFLWWLKQFLNKWRPLSQKAYQNSAYMYIYITKGQTEKSCRGFSRQWQFIANMDVKHSLIQWITVNSYHTFQMMSM